MNYLSFNLVFINCLLLFTGSYAHSKSNVQLILLSKNVLLGQKMKAYCATVSGSSNVIWYKRKGEHNYTIATGANVESPFSDTGRYSVKQWDRGGRPFELEISGVRKGDEGIIGCREGRDYSESELSVPGGITEVFVDMKPEGEREVPYKNPGEEVKFSQPLPEYGPTAKCHVQATTRNISITMTVAGQEVPSKLTGIDGDRINAEALQERVFLQHRYIENFKPGPELHLQRLDCVASSPNYPNVEFRNHVILNVEHKPKGKCLVTQPVDCRESIMVECEAAYNPRFIFAKWHRESSPDTYYGYHHEGEGVAANYTTDGEYRAKFILRIACSEDMPDEDTLWFTIGNLVGSVKLSMALSRPPPLTTMTTTNTRSLASTTSTMVTDNSSSPKYEESSLVYSGDQEEDELMRELPTYDELLPEVVAYDDLPLTTLTTDVLPASKPVTTPESKPFLKELSQPASSSIQNNSVPLHSLLICIFAVLRL